MPTYAVFKLAREVTAKDIAKLEDDIKAGAYGKPSVSNARHVRKALSSLFTWAAYPRQSYVTANPCAASPGVESIQTIPLKNTGDCR